MVPLVLVYDEVVYEVYLDVPVYMVYPVYVEVSHNDHDHTHNHGDDVHSRNHDDGRDDDGHHLVCEVVDKVVSNSYQLHLDRSHHPSHQYNAYDQNDQSLHPVFLDDKVVYDEVVYEVYLVVLV